MNIEQLIEEWNNDANMDDNHLDTESITVPKLHSKYISHLIHAKLKNSKIQNEFNILKKTKFRYYRGELSKDELKELQWEQWQGTKPLKNEMEQFLDGDVDLNTIQMKLEYLGSMIYLLESILNQIKARDWQIKNAINWKTFIAGG